MAKDTTLSRWRHGFESRWGCFIVTTPGSSLFCAAVRDVDNSSDCAVVRDPSAISASNVSQRRVTTTLFAPSAMEESLLRRPRGQGGRRLGLAGSACPDISGRSRPWKLFSDPYYSRHFRAPSAASGRPEPGPFLRRDVAGVVRGMMCDVTAQPETRYVDVGDAQVAYQVLGDGPLDVLFGWGIGSQIELQWAHPAWAGVLARFAAFSRLILFDRRGTGASDRLPRGSVPTWEEWAEDMGAVLDAAGSESAAIVAVRDNGPMAIMYAAMHPERVRALVLVGTAARLVSGPGYPIGFPPDAIEEMLEFVEKSWATQELLRTAFPKFADEPDFLRWWISMNHASITPRAAGALYRHIFATDVREALPLISVPTLVIHPTDNAIVPLEHAQYLAEHIQGARLIELRGAALGIDPFDLEPFFDPVTEFLTGEPPVVEVDRILATILFTDIVGSTQRAVSEGDRRWSAMLDDHHRIVRAELSRFRGREIDTAGDGFLATFDGPARAIRCACAIRDRVQALGLQVRAGLHTGEVELAGDDVRGIAVHVGARVGANANPDEVLVSHTVKDLVAGSGIEFEDRGEHELKGVPGTWNLFAVRG